jgi:hypothetical protein
MDRGPASISFDLMRMARSSSTGMYSNEFLSSPRTPTLCSRADDAVISTGPSCKRGHRPEARAVLRHQRAVLLDLQARFANAAHSLLFDSPAAELER